MDSTENWVCVYSSVVLHNVELLKHILKEKGISAVVMNQQDSFYPTIGEIRLLVRREDVIRANKTIEDSEI